MGGGFSIHAPAAEFHAAGNRSERILFRRIAPRFFQQDFPRASDRRRRNQRRRACARHPGAQSGHRESSEFPARAIFRRRRSATGAGRAGWRSATSRPTARSARCSRRCSPARNSGTRATSAPSSKRRTSTSFRACARPACRFATTGRCTARCRFSACRCTRVRRPTATRIRRTRGSIPTR